jgi:hypothetical protein
MFDVVGAHPSRGGHDGQGRVEAVQVEQQAAVVALQQRGDPTAPEIGRYSHAAFSKTKE